MIKYTPYCIFTKRMMREETEWGKQYVFVKRHSKLFHSTKWNISTAVDNTKRVRNSLKITRFLSK